VTLARVDDALVITTSAGGLRAFRSDDPRLVDDDGFGVAREKIGMSDRIGGLVYVDFDRLLVVLQDLASAADDEVPQDAIEAIEAFDYVIVGSKREGTTANLEGFVALD
jgi:hypothetical protein